jgi:Fe-S-cluster containining protein
MFSINLSKYSLENLENTHYGDLKDDDIIKLTNAFYIENIAPTIPGMKFNWENVSKLLNLSKCRRCGRCCRPSQKALDNPGIMVYDEDLITISKHTKHSFKALKRMTKINDNPVYNVGARYLALPCMFYIQENRFCKIYSYRPLICKIYPVSDSPEHDITVDVQCDFGKEIYIGALKYLRDFDKRTNIKK